MKLRLPLLLVGLLLLLSSIKVNAQFIGCDPSVPNNPIDLSPSAFNGSQHSPATYNSGIGYQCCGLSSTYSCETFTVTTHPNAIAMIIKVNANGANVVIKQTDCNTTITNNQFFCVTGGTTLQFSICSDENAPLNVQFETIGAPTVNSQTNATIGCTSPIQIQGYSEGTISLNSTNPGAIGGFNGLLNCNTGCGNQIQITPINGTPNSLTYQVCGASLAPSCIANGGNYCENITVNVYQPLSVSGLSNQLISICPGDPIPNITATVTGGLTPYTYFWNGPGLDQNLLLNDATISNLSAGSYSLEVYDATGCSSGVLSTTYNVIPAPTVNAGIDQSFCSPVNSIQIQGNTTPQTNLLWSGGSGSFSNSISPAAIYTPSPSEMVAGNITLTLTGSNVCGNSVDNVVITFNTTSGLVINGSVSDVVCFGTTTGAIDITVTNGSGNYSYVWSNGMTTEDITGLGSGIYSVQVNDLTYGCNNSIGFSVNNLNPGPIFSVSSIKVNPSCFGLNNGSISTSINGGTSPYTYAWSNGNGTNPNLNNVGAGIYQLTVTDANGCTSSLTESLVSPQDITISASVTDVTCFGNQNGAIDVTVNGGSPPYLTNWQPGNQLTQDLFGLNGGAYTITITDQQGCSKNTTFTVNEPLVLSGSSISNNPACFGATNGSIDFTPTGGNPGYTYSWSNGATSQDISGIGNGTYTVTLIDANGCSAQIPFIITEPNQINLAITSSNATCFGLSNGSSVASVSGGTPGYTYLWNTGSTTNSINNQLAGNYSLQVTDANGCIFNLNTTITQPAPIVATANVILPIACFGGQAIVLVNGAGGTPGYSGNGTFNEFAGTHTYVLIDQNGCIDSTTITVTQPAAFTAVASITSPIACSGGQATVVVSANGGVAPFSGTGTFTVSAGTYTYTLIDANGCVATTTINVTQPSPLVLSATIVNPVLCHGDSALVSIGASGGTPAFSGIGNYLVPAGNYTYFVSDLNGCNDSIGIQVTQPTLLTSSVSSINVSCNGANDGSAIVFYSGGTAPLSVLWSTGATSNSITNLSPGNYNVTITDANGCQNVHNLTITQPNILIASAVEAVPIACFNGNAAVLVSATGGTIPYSGVGTFFPTAGVYNYVLSDAQGCSDTATITILQPTALTAVATIVNPIACFGGQATINIAANGGVAPYTGIGNFNVSSGNQSFTVTDANGCAFVVSLFVPQATPLISPISAQNVSCFNAGNGSATANPIGGTPGYQYTWSTGGTGQTINNLIPGLYTVTVTDANGCQTTNQITITQPTILSINATLSAPVFCFGGNAVVSVSASGGTPTYTGTGNFNQAAGTTTYYVTDANGCVDSMAFTVVQPAQLIASVIQTSNVLCFGGTATVLVSATGGTPSVSGIGNFTVSAGWNSYTVTDNYGCQDTTSIFITQPTQLVANAIQTSAILCNGGNAVINVSASGGTPGYIGQGNFTVIAGTYTYTVSDTNGCTANTTISISQPNPLQAIATVTSPVVCNAGTGVITITGNGGTAPYSGTGSFTGIAGTYTYTIIDANGCTSSVTITLTQPPVLTVSLTQTNVNCNGFATGSITANPVGGQGPYTYLWSNNQVTQTVANLIAGSYSVQVTDNLGCTVNGSSIITQPLAPILLQESQTNILCFGNNTGSIDLSVSGGTSPYTYSWSNSATTQDLQNLIAGTYIVTVTDANGCIATLSIPVTQPAIPLTVGYTTTNVSCFGLSDGSIDVTPLGGTGPFTYYWTTGLASQDLSNLPAGQYIIAITDANNCVTSAQITINQPTAPLSGTITQLPITCYGADDGQLTANANGGTPPYSYTWSPSGQTGSIATMLAPGTYVVSIVDANGCTAAATDVLAIPPSLIAQMNISDNIVCLPSIATVTNASVGTFNNVLWTLSDGQSFTSNQFTLNLTSVGCIDITLLITNANGCTADTTISDAICVIPGPTAAFSTTNPEIDFSTGELSFVNNSINYIGSIWQFGDGTSATLDNPIHTYPAATIDSYNVMLVVYDANGCTDTAYSVVESNDLVRLTVPNGFTPNGDGLNDIFLPVVSNADQIKFYRFEVYNRWGQLIFESTKPGEGWDGKFNGKQAQFGVYSWSVRFEVPENDPVSASGHVTLIK